MKPRYSISIVTYTALEHARRCVAAVMAHSRDYELILTANGSANAAWFFKKLALEFKHVRVVENAVNQGFWRPHNHALTLAQGEFFVCLNDDVLVPKRLAGGLEPALSVLQEGGAVLPGRGLLGAG